MPATAAAVQTDRADEPDQLQLRFFAIIDGFTRRPPERALWRVLIDTALAKTDMFMARGRRISAEAVHHVALALYMQADAAGVIHGFSEEYLAGQCRMSERNVRAARRVLNDLRVVRSIPGKGRLSGVHRMNLGGLDWPAVRRRAGSPRGDTMSPLGSPDGDPRGDTVSGQSDPRGDMVSGQNGPRGDTVSGPMGCTVGLSTIGLFPDPDPDLESVPAGSPGTAREAACRPDEPASEQQVAMFMSLQRKHRLHSQHVSEEDVAKWPRAQISEELNILEDLEERRGRVPTREELRRLEQLKRRL